MSELLQNQTSPVLPLLFGGRDSQAVTYEMFQSAACRTPKRVAKCGSCLSLGNPLRRSRVSDGQTCGVVKCESSLPAATVCGDRACRTNMWWNVNFLGHGQPSAEIAQVGRPNMWQNSNLARPGGTSGSTVKNLFKVVVLKVQMQAWHESQTAITVRKLPFCDARCTHSRIGVKLRLYPFHAK